jgi:hypothetical protein
MAGYNAAKSSAYNQKIKEHSCFHYKSTIEVKAFYALPISSRS